MAWQHVQPVIKVAAEYALLHLCHKVLVRGGDNAHVYINNAVRANAHHLLFLQNAQQAGLERQRHIANFIQKNRAAVCLFKQSFLAALPCAGERAPFIAEQFAFKQAFRQRGAVDGNERFVPAGGGVVYGLRNKLLARAAFALYKHGFIGTGEQPRAAYAFIHHGGNVHDIIKAVLGNKAFLERFLAGFALQPADIRYVVEKIKVVVYRVAKVERFAVNEHFAPVDVKGERVVIHIGKARRRPFRKHGGYIVAVFGYLHAQQLVHFAVAQYYAAIRRRKQNALLHMLKDAVHIHAF